ncbi:rRNA maturation RNase YbeY [Jiella sp. MQZ9-1]|uniref:Endoribonuclease YbeY n=1 Tax=Jiella flava TaxID=2816857 RepID=A0A939FV11_9HYPH|nr:rRNA maturation RNase YbeY [Jiella flava]MBO0661359.1 rRNA maturation RNase YbeY [Jiella flava]MCD2470004.1 rRNA maturation RNase YbeY [Jiella flava]
MSAEGDVCLVGSDLPVSLPGYPDLTLAIAVECEAWEAAFPHEALTALAAKALAAAANHLDLPASLTSEIAVTFADDRTVQEANRDWRDKDKPTNILSFPMSQLETGDLPGPLAGDLLIAFETVAREAEAEAKTTGDHLSHLIVHGFLHLLGYDHLSNADAETMEAHEVAILAALGIADPYGDGNQ